MVCTFTGYNGCKYTNSVVDLHAISLEVETVDKENVSPPTHATGFIGTVSQCSINKFS